MTDFAGGPIIDKSFALKTATDGASLISGSISGPLFFLIYINDLVENVSCDVRLFADDMSLFSVVNYVATTAFEMNCDLEKIKLWAWQWKMQFNTDKTEEVIFSTKRIKPDHPPLKLGDDVISHLGHKHLGMVLDSKLDFKSHLREAIVNARHGIGMTKHLSRYVSRDVLIQLYKLYVRRHLDYGDITYQGRTGQSGYRAGAQRAPLSKGPLGPFYAGRNILQIVNFRPAL